MSVKVEFDNIRVLILNILENHPEARDNDTLLYLEACKYLGAKSIEDLVKLNLSIISIHKMRQVIQNKEGLFKPSEETEKARSRRRVAIKEYMSRLG
ncbi:hypothetical protein [Peribacillus asahii]|nr:hypothetical protein [Peribacillus asahii]